MLTISGPNFPHFDDLNFLVKFWSSFGQVLFKCWRFQAFLFSPQKWSKIEEEEKVAYFSQFPSFFFQRFFNNSLVGIFGFFCMKTVLHDESYPFVGILDFFEGILGGFWGFQKKNSNFFLQHSTPVLVKIFSASIIFHDSPGGRGRPFSKPKLCSMMRAIHWWAFWPFPWDFGRVMGQNKFWKPFLQGEKIIVIKKKKKKKKKKREILG